MSGLGRTLQEARRKRGLTLDDAERETRIRKRYLLALEQEDFAVLPPPVFAQGFIRVYADFLDVDPSPMVAQFTKETGATVSPQPLGNTPLIQRPASSSVQRLSSIATVALLLVSAVSAYFLFQVIRTPVVATFTSIRQTVQAGAGDMRLPLVSDLALPWTGFDGAEGDARKASAAPAGGAIPLGDAAGGGDRLPATANVPKVLAIPPWFLPPPTSDAAVAGSLKMPVVTGRSADDARVALEKLGLAVATEYWWSAEIPAGFVVFQHPRPQQAVDRSQPVVVVISRGPVRLTVPDLVGRPQAEALRELQQAGLLNTPIVHYQGPKELSPAALNAACNGCVLSIAPAPGAEVPPEGVIVLAVRKD